MVGIVGIVGMIGMVGIVGLVGMIGMVGIVGINKKQTVKSSIWANNLALFLKYFGFLSVVSLLHQNYVHVVDHLNLFQSTKS